MMNLTDRRAAQKNVVREITHTHSWNYDGESIRSNRIAAIAANRHTIVELLCA